MSVIAENPDDQATAITARKPRTRRQPQPEALRSDAEKVDAYRQELAIAQDESHMLIDEFPITQAGKYGRYGMCTIADAIGQDIARLRVPLTRRKVMTTLASIDPGPQELGGGWKVTITENGVEIAGAVFPAMSDSNEASQVALEEAKDWLDDWESRKWGEKKPRDAVKHILDKCRAAKNGANYLSTGESLVAALVLNRSDWLAEMNYTIPEALERIGPEWAKQIPAVARILREEG
ncbi:MAG: hypothetical protein LBV29_08040 [Azoarcus sp.]|jgi:hypothetical protein|nr:hypothetical protein [Azoarcus sp.]